MKDILQDIIAHTYSLGFLPLIKVTGSGTETVIESLAEDRTVVMDAKTHKNVDEFEGVFGMPNLDKLNLHLKNPEYKENSKITVITEVRNGKDMLTGIHFENAAGDFVNDYRFMVADIINAKLKTAKFKGTTWDIDFQPSVASIQRLRLQSQVHTEENFFQVKTENNNLVFFFGDASTHAGSFVFQSDVKVKFKNNWGYPVTQVNAILGLGGDITMFLTDQGAMQITVDSGLARYNYILPGQSK